MEYLKEFYGNLSDKKKIVLWVSLFFILFSIIRLTVWAGKGGVPGPRDFAKKLASNSPEEKKFAIYEVSRLGMKSAVPSLVKIIKEDAEPEIKRAAAASLGKIDREQLIALLDETQKDIKYTVMEALIKVDRGNVSHLMERFSKEDAETKMLIFSYVDSVTDILYRDKMMSIGENTEEDVKIRAEALRMTAKYEMDSGTETRLWNLYYNDPEDEIKKLAYNLIKEGKKR